MSTTGMRDMDAASKSSLPPMECGPRRARRMVPAICGILLAGIAFFGFGPAAPAAATVNPDPVQYYYVPFTETQLFSALQAVESGGTGDAPESPLTNHITLTAVANGTLIYYDHWENGYDQDIANPGDLYGATNTGGTQIWGDGIASNGVCPGTVDDSIRAGMVIDLANDVAVEVGVPRDEAIILYDGRDKIAATKTIAMTRTTWAAESGTLFAGSVEVYDLYAWGTDYRAPVGTNMPDGTDYQMFSYTALSIMAGMDGASVSYRAGTTGGYTTASLDEGETIWVTDCSAGAHVYTTDGHPVQVHIFTGDVGSNYESRDSALIPTGTWSNDYYTPVATPHTAQGETGTDTTVWLFNAGGSSIDVTYKRWVDGAIDEDIIPVGAMGYAKQVLADGTGAEFYSASQFYAFSTTDSSSGDYGDNQAWDWSFTLVPKDRLSTQLLVGLGIGRDPTSSTSPTQNANPIWVTPHIPVGETIDGHTYTADEEATIYVDYDGDPSTGPEIDGDGHHYDVAYSLKDLENQKIYRNASGAPVTVDGTSSTASTTGATSLTVNHTTGTGSDRLMIVSVALGDSIGPSMASVTSVTYGSQTLTPITSSANGFVTRCALFALAAPASGSGTVTVNTSDTVAFTMGVTTFAGADVSHGLSSALRTPATANGAGSAMTVSPTSINGDLVYEAVSANGGPITVDRDSTASTTGATSLTVSHTTASTANLMLVSIALGDEDGTTATVSSVTHNGDALTAVGTTSNAGTRVAIYARATPDTGGPFNVVVNVNESVPFTVGVTTFIGANVATGLTSALGSYTQANGTGSAMTVDPATTPGDMVYEAISTRVGVAVDATGPPASTNGAISLTIDDFTTGSAANLMLVSVALGDNSGGTGVATVSSVAYGGVALDLVGTSAYGTTTGTRATIYALANPTTGTPQDVVVNVSESVPFTVGVTTFIGADVSSGLASALRTPTTATSNTTDAMAVAPTSSYGDLAYEAVSIRNSDRNTTSPGAINYATGISELWWSTAGNANRLCIRGAAATLPAAGTGTSTTFSLDQSNGPYQWAMVGVSIRWQGVTVDATSTPVATNGATSLAVNNFTTGSAANLMLVSVALGDNSGGTGVATVSSVAYGGVALDLVGTSAYGTTTGTRATIYALANPTTGTPQNVVVNVSESVPFTVGVTTFIGADVSSGLASALRTPTTATSNTTDAMAVAPTSSYGDLAYEAVCVRNAGTIDTVPGPFNYATGVSGLWTATAGNVDFLRTRGAAATLPAAGTGTSTTFSLDQSNGPYQWAMVGVSIRGLGSFPNEPTRTSGQARRWTNAAGGSASAVRGAAGTLLAGSGSSTTITETQTNGPYPWAMGSVVIHKAATTTTPTAFTATSSQTRAWSTTAVDAAGLNRVRGAAGTLSAATGGSTTITETQTNGPFLWAMAGVAIVPASLQVGDQSGMLIYTLDENIKLAGAWGQDPLAASAGAPGLDVGTTVPPMPEISASKDATLAVDNDADGQLTVGDVIEYTIRVYNVSRLTVPDVIVYDTVPADTAYVVGSTRVDGSALADDTAGNETSPDTTFPLDGNGVNVGNLAYDESCTITFRMTVTGSPTYIQNDGRASALNSVVYVRERSYPTLPTKAHIGDFVWYDRDGDGIQDAGEQGLAGITVRLTDISNNVLTTTTTGSDGSYSFLNVDPGTYRIQFSIPSDYGLSFSPANQGTDDAIDSDATTRIDDSNYRTGNFTVATGWYRQWDQGCYPPTPTLAAIGSFEAYVASGRVVVTWKTLSEENTAGFLLERFNERNNTWTKVNTNIVPALLESPAGGSYSVVDEGARANSVITYRLIEVEASGTELVYGPYQVMAERPLSRGQIWDAISRGERIVRIPTSLFPTGDPDDTDPAWSKPAKTKPASTNQLRMETTTAGLYRVTSAEIAAGLGMTEASAKTLIKNRGVKLTSQGRTVSYLPATDNSAVYFYGKAIDSIYTSTNVYWLAKGKGTTMAAVTSVPAGSTTTTQAPTTTTDGATTTTDGATPTTDGATTTTTEAPQPAETFIDTLHEEQDLMPATALFHDPAADFWHGVYMYGGYSSMDTKTITVEVPDVVSGVTLGVNMLGLTSTGRTNEHHVQVSLNGTLLGDLNWTDSVPYSKTLSIPAGVLVAGTNRVELKALKDSGVAYTGVALDSLDVTYERTTEAVDDQLLLNASATGTLKVSGLSASDAWVLDLSDPTLPRRVTSQSTTDGSGDAALLFSAVKGHKYLVSTAAGALASDAITSVTPGKLKTTSRGANYVVITAPGLVSAANRLAAYRATQGLRTAVVTTAEIYDDFNYGVASPQAIKAFIAYASRSWRPVAKYVVLAGDGSFDYKDCTGTGESVVPPLMVDTAGGLIPSDVFLADNRSNDGVPEVAIGRIPAVTTADLDAALAKIKGYEADTNASTWRRTAVLVADNNDAGGDFEASSESIKMVIPTSFQVTKVYLGAPENIAAARANLTTSLSLGSLLVNYTGHAGVGNWADEGLLTKADVAALPATGTRLPIVTGLTCVSGQYGLPGLDGLSESLVKRTDAGAIAVWSSDSLVENDDSVALGRLFYQNLFGTSHTPVLGDVMLAAQKAARTKSRLSAEFMRSYNLLGDPALRVRW